MLPKNQEKQEKKVELAVVPLSSAFERENNEGLGDGVSPKLIPIIPEILKDGLDEMNFAEFPFGVVGTRVEPGQDRLVFRDQIYDRAQKKVVERKVTISGANGIGLPTACDDEVFLGLIQLSKMQGFESQTVHFTRYQLIKLLGWSIGGESYRRIEESINRLIGVSLFFDNAWRDKATNSWVSEKFHILDRCSIDQGENERNRPKPDPAQINFEFATSLFKWNDVVWRNLKNGNVKALDFAFFLGLSRVTRRLYRFLDKRFYFSKSLEFDLKVLSFQHIGLSQRLKVGDLKRFVAKAADELVKNAYLKPATKQERFFKVKAGEWKVRFERNGNGAISRDTEAENVVRAPIVKLLSGFGVAIPKAKELATRFPEEFIRKKVEVFKWMQKNNDKRISQNPPGFLITSIEQDFAPPNDFLEHQKQQAQIHKQRTEENDRAGREQKRKNQAQDRENQREAAIRQFWASLSPETLKQAEAEALAGASSSQRDWLNRGGPLAESVRKNLLDEYALNALAQG